MALAIVNLTADSGNQHNHSRKVTAPNINLLKQQVRDFAYEAICD